MERALGAARADAFVGRTPAASTSAVTCAARPRAFHGACFAWARSRESGDSAMQQRERDGERGTRAVSAKRDGATVLGQNAMRNGEANPRVSGLGRHERLKGASECFGVDRWSIVVNDADPGAVCGRDRANADIAAF